MSATVLAKVEVYDNHVSGTCGKVPMKDGCNGLTYLPPYWLTDTPLLLKLAAIA